ncbi:phosphotransferase family protein [Mycobacterium terramassiliense]|uniref:Predicted kinase, aminoglycoside phosphotransferase (APT) family n=1 Tax=Mycobacterium terramassiliense TaxID=1841859 RepID=A0A2U3N9N5_9MYCO|nr:phosphotransferase family protein [Mycobacterium terramassiliense]SPM28187.1 Predicted kinase, aminoglycoside phosphotransferase (APT) family [Mycobacterium terramassiliense]
MPEVDLEELGRRLAAVEVVGPTPLAGGASSLTFRGERHGRAVVIKVAPPGVEPVAHRDVLRQARIMKALAATQVPVPDVVWEDPGNPPDTPPLFVMSHVEGDCVEPLFDGCPPGAELAERYRGACRAMAALHGLSPRGLGLAGEPVTDPVAEVQRWCDTLQTVDAALVPGWRDVRDALLACAPTAMGPSVVHGDFRLGNLMAVGARITAVIDWEIWSIGDPRIDAGWFLINCDRETYRRVPSSAGVAPPAGELAKLYERELGCEVTDLGWFSALACFKSAATWSLIVKHNRRRRAPRAEWEAMAPALPRLLARARSMLA